MNMQHLFGDRFGDGLDGASPLTNLSSTAEHAVEEAHHKTIVWIEGKGYPLSFSRHGQLTGRLDPDSTKHLYIMTSGGPTTKLGYKCKIGIAKDAWRRLENDLQPCSPVRIFLDRAYEVPECAAFWLEKHTHHLLWHVRSHHEWFRCSLAQAIAAVEHSLTFAEDYKEFYSRHLHIHPEWRKARMAFRRRLHEILPPPEPPIP